VSEPIDNPYTRGMASFISGVSLNAVPKDVRERLKLLILDALGCALYGADLEWTRILIDTLSAVDETRTTGLWGTRHRLSPLNAALVNGTMVQGFELDDVHRNGVLHVGAVTLPALIAIAETRPGMTGADFLTAAVAGYEIGPRVGMCMGQEHITQGWHSGATVGVFSAAAGAARALGLSTDQTVHALGIAGTQSAGLMAAQFGAMVKRMHAGKSSQSGLYGALLAEGGFTGIHHVFEAEYGGFCTTFSRSQDRFDRAQLTAGLGEIFEIMRIALKFYSCVGSNQTTLDAVRLIRERRPFEIDELERIVVHASEVTFHHTYWRYEPVGMTSAQLNLPFCVATLLIEGEVFVDQFGDGDICDPARIELSRKVEVVEDPAITALGSKFRHKVWVEVFLKDGTRHKETVESARGSEHRFAAAADVVGKFETLAGKMLPPEQVGQLRDAILGLEELPQAAEIGQLLCPPAS
jgi:aconitate decarboxylase